MIKKTHIGRMESMVSIITDERVFYVTVYDDENNELEDEVNPVAIGIKSCIPSTSLYDKLMAVFRKNTSTPLAVFSWYDLANQQMRSFEVVVCDYDNEGKCTIKTKDEFTYKFDLMTKRIYETILHPQGYVAGPDTFENDDAVQRWFKQFSSNS